jgi:RNA polymerase sigma-70 factor (ECF subfamily)
MDQHSNDRDAQLLVRSAAGDGVAFGILYRRYLPLVLRWCWSQTGDRELAADLSSEVFAAALIHAHRYRAEQGPPIAWLLGIARNKLLESRRAGRVESRARRRLGLAVVELTDDDLARVEELSSLDSAAVELAAQLPDEQRRAVLGRIVEERSYEQLAAELRCSPAVVRKRVSRGLNALRAQMEDR